MENYMAEFLLLGENVRKQRMKKKMTQTELANKSGYSRASISALECGRGNPSIEMLIRLARVLQIEVYYFLIDTRRIG